LFQGCDKWRVTVNTLMYCTLGILPTGREFYD